MSSKLTQGTPLNTSLTLNPKLPVSQNVTKWLAYVSTLELDDNEIYYPFRWKYEEGNVWMYFGQTFGIGTSRTKISSAYSFFQDGLMLGKNSNYAVTAVLEMKSTTKGCLMPRMTTAEKNAIANTQGLVVYDTDLNKLCYNTGAAWVNL